MHCPHRYIASLFLTAALAAPMSMMAAPLPQQDRAQVRVYDKNHKDYHNWDDNENHALTSTLGECPLILQRITCFPSWISHP
jgi:hypothetical protein